MDPLNCDDARLPACWTATTWHPGRQRCPARAARRRLPPSTRRGDATTWPSASTEPSPSPSTATPATSSAGCAARRDGTGPDIVVNGFVGWSVGENLMGGTIRVRGSASQSAGSSARGGLIIVEGDASLRAGISLKGGTLAVAGDAGAMTGFMAQAGTILIGGDAGHGLGDSLYEAVIYVAGTHRLARAPTPGRGAHRRRRAGRQAPGRGERLRPHRARPGDQGGLGPPAVPLLHPQPRLLLMAWSTNRLEGMPHNASFPPEVIARIHEMADTGHYPIRGLGRPPQAAHLRRPGLPHRLGVPLPA